jgi:predicted transcriptional regulator
MLMASRVVSLRLKEEDAAKLDRLARQMQRTPSATAALLLAEKLKQEQFPDIEFKQTAAGREAFVKGSRLKVWQVAMYARNPDMDAAKIAALLEFPEYQIAAALAYAKAFPEEIDPIVEDVENMTAEEFVRRYPGARVVQV